MNQCKLEPDKNNEFRILDSKNHFKGKCVGGVLYLYCKRCGIFHVLPGFKKTDNTVV